MIFTMYRKSDSCNTEPFTRVEFHPAVKFTRQLIHDLGQQMARSCTWPMPDGSKVTHVWGCLSWPGGLRHNHVLLDLNPLRDGCTTGILKVTFTRSGRVIKRLTQAKL